MGGKLRDIIEMELNIESGLDNRSCFYCKHAVVHYSRATLECPSELDFHCSIEGMNERLEEENQDSTFARSCLLYEEQELEDQE